MEKLYLVATIAGQPVAIPAAVVDSVVDIARLSPVPLAAPHIAGLAAVRSRVLTIVCGERALGLKASARRPTRAVVMDVDGHRYGLLVGAIEDARIIEDDPHPVPMRLAAGWARVAVGLLDFEGESLLLIDPVRLISGPLEIAA